MSDGHARTRPSKGRAQYQMLVLEALHFISRHCEMCGKAGKGRSAGNATQSQTLSQVSTDVTIVMRDEAQSSKVPCLLTGHVECC